MAEQEELAEAIRLIRAPLREIALHRAYYTGQHRLAFATDKYRTAFGALFTAFADNFCASVVDTLADRLQLTGFGTTAAAKRAWELWKSAKLKRISGQVHTEAFTVGNCYLIVWPAKDDPGRPVFTVEPAEVCTVYYDPEMPGQVSWAAKMWMQLDGRARLTLYYADRLEKYITTGKVSDEIRAGMFVRYEVPGEAWPLPNLFKRVPVFHFANNAPLGRYGRSELCDVIPLQDALNKVRTDMLVAMEFVALPQRWAAGVEFDTDPVTKEPIIPWKAGYDRIWGSADPDTKFGEFMAGDLRQFLDVHTSFAIDIGRVSRTPMHYIIPPAGVPPSGEALKTAEQPLTSKALDRAELFGETWVEALVFALAITSYTAKADDLAPDWQDPAPKSQKEAADTAAVKKTIGVPLRVLLRELDYTETEIEEMLTQAATDQQAATDLALARVRADQLAAQTVGALVSGNGSRPAVGDLAPAAGQ